MPRPRRRFLSNYHRGPGFEPKDIDVSIVANTLTIKASRERGNNDDNQTDELSFGRLERALTLPKGVENGQVKDSYKHGVLELTMPASPELVGRKMSFRHCC
jgi:HSP20 family protein